MTERERKILLGKTVTPKTADEKAIKYAVDNGGGGGGGGGKFVVTLTQTDETWTADKTVAEIVEAHNAGKICVAVGDFEGGDIPFILEAFEVSIGQISGGDFAMFCCLSVLEGSALISVSGFHSGSTDSWEIAKTTIPREGVPDYNSSDNGKVLGIVDGALAWVTP